MPPAETTTRGEATPVSAMHDSVAATPVPLSTVEPNDGSAADAAAVKAAALATTPSTALSTGKSSGTTTPLAVESDASLATVKPASEHSPAELTMSTGTAVVVPSTAPPGSAVAQPQTAGEAVAAGVDVNAGSPAATQVGLLAEETLSLVVAAAATPGSSLEGNATSPMQPPVLKASAEEAAAAAIGKPMAVADADGGAAAQTADTTAALATAGTNVDSVSTGADPGGQAPADADGGGMVSTAALSSAPTPAAQADAAPAAVPVASVTPGEALAPAAGASLQLAPIHAPATTPVSSPAGTPTSVPVPVAAQLFAHVTPLRLSADGVQTLTVMLHPQDLGAVQVRAELRDGVVSLQLIGSTDIGRDALRAALPDLRRDLVSAGVTTGSVDLGSTMSDTGTFSGQASDRRTSTPPPFLPNFGEPVRTPAAASAAPSLRGSRGLDVSI